MYVHTVLKAPRYVNYLNRKRATLVVAVFDWFRCCGTGVVVVVFELRTSLVSLASTIVKQTTKQLALHLLLICLFLIYESDFQHCLHCFLCSPSLSAAAVSYTLSHICIAFALYAFICSRCASTHHLPKMMIGQQHTRRNRSTN